MKNYTRSNSSNPKTWHSDHATLSNLSPLGTALKMQNIYNERSLAPF